MARRWLRITAPCIVENKRRKPGELVKYDDETAAQLVAEGNAAYHGEAPQPVKKKRGRPKKEPVAEAPQPE